MKRRQQGLICGAGLDEAYYGGHFWTFFKLQDLEYIKNKLNKILSFYVCFLI